VNKVSDLKNYLFRLYTATKQDSNRRLCKATVVPTHSALQLCKKLVGN